MISNLVANEVPKEIAEQFQKEYKKHLLKEHQELKTHGEINIPLKDIEIKIYPQIDSIYRFNELIDKGEFLNGAGDDVGNGGDHLRKEFIFAANALLEEINSSELTEEAKKIININRVKIVQEITGNYLGNQIVLLSKAHNGYILLTDEFIDVLENSDPRYEILKLILSALGRDESSAKEIYAKLNILKNERLAPYCMIYDLENIISIEQKDVTIKSSESESSAISQAKFECESKYLDCYKKESMYKGFLFSGSYNATYSGKEVNLIKANENQIKEFQCIQLKSCESLYELAPFGQVRPKDFKKLDLKIQNSCI